MRQGWSNFVVAPQTPNPSPTDNELHAVAATSGSDVWAVGQYGGSSGAPLTLALHRDGSKWSKVGTPNGDATQTNVLNGVSADAPGDA